MKALRPMIFLVGATFLVASLPLLPTPQAEARRRKRRARKKKRKARKKRVSRRRRRRAKKLFRRAEKKYSLGEFQAALRSYTKAYEAWPLPAFLYNIGLCHSKMGAHERAVHFMREFLRHSANAARRAIVEKDLKRTLALIEAKKLAEKRRLAKLEADRKAAADRRARLEKLRLEKERLALERARRPRRIALAARRVPAGARPEAIPPSRPTPAPPQASPFYKKWWFWTIVVGVVAAGVGAGVGVALGGKKEVVPPSGSLGSWDFR